MSDKKHKHKSPDRPDGQPRAGENENGGPAQGAPETPQAEPQAGSGEAPKAGGWGAGQLEELRAENADLKDRLLRTVAEMENVRRRTERDKQDTVKYAVSNFARDVLTIADNIQRAIAHVPEDAAGKDSALKSFLEGVQMTERELMNVMERHGIARLDPKGEKFDPNMHQAMFEVPNPDVPEGTVIEVVQPGYVIADRVLRPAMVGVAKGGPKVARESAEAPKAANDDARPEKPEGPPPGGDGGPGGRVDRSA